MSLIDPLRAVLRQRGLGYLPEPPSKHDLLLGTAPFGGNFDSDGTIASPLVDPKAQGGTQSCSGQAVVQGARESALANGLDCPELSGLANYIWGRAVWGGQHTDAGSFLRTGCYAAAKLGIPSESKWPFSPLKVNVSPNGPAVYDAAKRRRSFAYYRIAPGDLDGIRRAIYHRCAVVGGWRVDKAFTQDQGDWIIGAQDTSQIVGGHALLIDGYNHDGSFNHMGSWGRNWRDRGRVRLSEAFVSKGMDIWAILVT